MLIEHDEMHSRFVALIAGEEVGVATYRQSGNRWVFDHTIVNASVEGKGVGSALIRYALDEVRRGGGAIASECWFVTEFLDKHPEYQRQAAPGAFATRKWSADDFPFLWNMLYQSLHVREGDPPFPMSVIDEPSIAHYLVNFGRSGDDAQIAVTDAGTRIGAAWCRRMPADDPGYGFVDADTPELGMAIESAWRAKGIGKRLLTELLVRNPAMSLSVDTDNANAIGLYRDLGFVEVRRDGDSLTMLRSSFDRAG